MKHTNLKAVPEEARRSGTGLRENGEGSSFADKIVNGKPVLRE